MHQDNTVTVINNNPYVINRLGADSLIKLDSKTFKPIWDIDIDGAKSNPHSIISLTDTLFLVSLYGRNYLKTIDSNTGKTVGNNISLAFFQRANDTDGSPDASSSLKVDDYVYTTLENYDNKTFTNTMTGRIIRTTVKNNVVTTESFVELNASPNGSLTLSPDKKSFYVSTNNSSNFDAGVGILKIDIQTKEVSVLLSEADAGISYITSYIIISDTLGFISGYTGGAYANNILKAFNPSTKTIIKDLEIGSGVATTIAHFNNKLYVADRVTTKEGIRIFNTSTNDFIEETKTPINTGLPPASLAIFKVAKIIN